MVIGHLFIDFVNSRKAHLVHISCRLSLGSPLQYVCCKELKELHYQEVDFTFYGTCENQLNFLVSKHFSRKSRMLFILDPKGGSYWTLAGQGSIRKSEIESKFFYDI